MTTKTETMRWNIGDFARMIVWEDTDHVDGTFPENAFGNEIKNAAMDAGCTRFKMFRIPGSRPIPERSLDKTETDIFAELGWEPVLLGFNTKTHNVWWGFREIGESK